MAKKVKEYSKLPGSKKGFFLGRYTLWQGADHLLYIFARFGVEDYKRFYFSDIQAIIIRKTVAGKIQNGILAGLALLFTLLVFSVSDARATILNGGALFFIFMAAIMLGFLLINFLRGPTCETKLLTAVQTETLPSLSRLKRAIKIADKLRPLIRQAQRAITEPEPNQTPAGPAGPDIPRHLKPTRMVAKKDVRKENGKAHMILFALLLFDGLLATSEFFVSHVLPTLLSSFASLGIGIFVIIALVRQHNSDLPGSLRTLTWTCFGFVGVTFIMGYVVAVALAFNDPTIFANQWQAIKSMANLSPWSSSLKLSCNILVLCGALFIAMPGLMILQRSRSQKVHPAQATPAATGRRTISPTAETG